MLQILNEIFTWLINGIKDIFNIILSIPKYTVIVFNYIQLLPSWVIPFVALIVTAYIIIHIKRLVFS